MDPALEHRIDAIVARARDRRERAASQEDDMDALRVAHDHVLSEVPAALARLKAAVEEANDAVAQAGLHLTLDETEGLHVIEVSYVVSLWPSDERELGLVFNVSQDGLMIVMTSSRQSRSRLKSIEIGQADRAFFLDALVSFLESVV